MREIPGRRLLACCAWLVPESHRDEWRAEWEAEMVHAWTEQRQSSPISATWSLRWRCMGALRDALWMRRRYGFTTSRSPMLTSDVRYALRSLLRKPAFTTIVVATLALCIGASTAMFSVVNSMLLDGIPYRDSDRLVSIWSNDTRNGRDRNEVSVGDYRDMRARARTVESLTAYFAGWNATYTDTDVAERLDIGVVTANFLTTLGVTPVIGRGFVDGEDEPGTARVVVLSHAFWTRQFAQDTGVVGRNVLLDGQSYQVVGILGSDFLFPDARVDLLAPLPMLGAFLDRREVRIVKLIGRLRASTTADMAQRDFVDVAKQLEAEHPAQNAGFSATVLPTRAALLGEVRTPLLVLFGAVCAVLLIGCANVANLMLARAASRRQELAVRTALGAARGRLVRQLLTETALVAIAAGTLGLAIAWFATRGISAALPPTMAKLSAIRINLPVLAFTLGTSLLTALLCGLVPAWHGARTTVHDALRESGRGTPSASRRRAQSAFVVTELALSLVLVVAAGLLITSFNRLTSIDPGFRTTNVVRMKLSLAGSSYGNAVPRQQLYNGLLTRLRDMPGVQSVGVVTRFPLHDSNIPTAVRVEGIPDGGEQLPDADLRTAGGDYFATMGISLIAGRVFSWGERTDSGAVPVAIINEAAALKLFGDRSPIGRRMQLGGHANSPWFEVVGVVANVHDASLREAPRPQVFQSFDQTLPRTVSIVAAYDGASTAVVHGARSILRDLDPALPIYDVQRIEEVIEAASVSDRFSTLLISAFSGIALLLALVGTYGVIAFGVTERTREIGVRIALGAQRSTVRAMILRQALRLLAVALPVGVAGAWALTRLMQGLLYGVGAFDLATVTISAILLTIAALAACYVPARRASSIDPLQAMRAE